MHEKPACYVLLYGMLCVARTVYNRRNDLHKNELRSNQLYVCRLTFARCSVFIKKVSARDHANYCA